MAVQDVSSNDSQPRSNVLPERQHLWEQWLPRRRYCEITICNMLTQSQRCAPQDGQFAKAEVLIIIPEQLD
jgi:hypothetical protein